HLTRGNGREGLYWTRTRSSARFGGESVAAIAFNFRGKDDFMALRPIKVATNFDLVATREEFHLRHSRLDANSFRRHFHRVDRIIKFDADCRLLERVIKGSDPFDLERLRFPHWDHL